MDVATYNSNCAKIEKWGSVLTYGDLDKLSVDQKADLCVKANSTVEEITVQLNEDVKGLAGEEESLQKQLEDTAQKTVDAAKKVETNEKELKSLEKRLTELKTELKQLESQLRDLSNEVKDLENKKAEAIRRRTNALAPPIVGFFAGIIEGRPERMIPGYDQVNAIVSFCEQDYENAQRRQSDKKSALGKCVGKIASTTADVDNKSSQVSSSKSTLQALQAKRDRLQKACGVISQQKTGVSLRQKEITGLRDQTTLLVRDAKMGAKKQDNKKIFENKMGKVITELTKMMSGMKSDYKISYDQGQELKKLLA